MEAVGRVWANCTGGVQGVVCDGSSALNSGGNCGICSVRLVGKGSGLPLHARRKTVHLKSETRAVDDGLVFSMTRNFGVFSSSSNPGKADEEEEEEEVRQGSPDQVVSGMDSLFWRGAALLMASLKLQDVMAMHAVAGESESNETSQAVATAAVDAASTAVAAASSAPSWLPPTILAFPLVSYFLFGLYRDKVNPGAKVTDWLFILVAVGIVANIVLRATLGVRLY